MQTVIPPLTGRAQNLSEDEIFERALQILRQKKVGTTSTLSVIPTAEDFPEVKPRTRAIEVWNGSVCVRIYRMKWRDKKRRRTYRKDQVYWTDAGRLFKKSFSNPEAAKKWAEQVAAVIAKGETNRLQFSQADIASFFRIKDMAAKAGAEPELLVAEACDARRALNGVPMAEAVRFYNLQNPIGSVAKKSSDVIQEFFAKRKLCAKWKRNLQIMLDRFTARFPGPLTDLIARDVDDWLDNIEGRGQARIGLRARHNHRAAVAELCEFAKMRGYLPQAWTVMASVSDPEPDPIQVNIYSPDELLRLLNTAETYEAGRKLVPFIAITALAGVRHGEMNEEKVRLLDWGDFDFETKTIYVAKNTAKTGNDRVVDMPDNLVAWLKPYARPSGKIVPLENTGSALCRLRIKAGIKGPKRNALRKSFISYKNALTRNIDAVADQAGNSAHVIRKNYKVVDSRMQKAAHRWFSLMPDRADLLPLFAWQQHAAG